ncbi:phage regulatory CII family protein [Roseibium algae]|uniref:Phage regulatory CII family protein n=1 Tax=Roseibium algae TaxID=3123038 RepID=A0ABU8TR72_9HYPH
MELNAAKQAFRECVKLAGGFEAAADLMGVSKTLLHNLQSPNMPDDPRERPLSFLMRLEDAAQKPCFLTARAASHGMVLMPAASSECDDFRDVLLKFAAVAGRLVDDGSQAFEDKRIDAAEEKTLRADLHAIASAVHELASAVNKERGR